MRAHRTVVMVAVVAAIWSACGGKAVVDGGSGASGSTSSGTDGLGNPMCP